MRSTASGFLGGLVLAALLLTVPCLASAAVTSIQTVNPAAITMGTQYDGVDLTVTGSVPATAEVIVRLVGTPDELHLLEKGKVFGLLWMNVGKVTLTNVPGICLVSSSRPLAQMGAGAASYRLESLIKAIGIEQDGGDQSIDIAHELLLLKSKEGLYRESVEGIALGEVADGVRQFTARITVPPSLKPGAYQVELIAVQDGTVVGQAHTAIQAALTGLPKWLSEFAYQRSILYGIMATVIAIVSGLIIGLVFQSKGAH